ncbi:MULTISPECIES: dTDP-glucose 4,6-dehydratase [Streptomyces]|uniref:dTDP-glucose 4,6-dehydratase n=1 Tax=Streptomyces siderophoricus TaxID=2802281 RepID=A0ABS1MTB2_9ACTN|nr:MULTISPECIES: dTDP-glucose 4,6-dehydratase [unclassified Streptomyces]MBL1090984.1 dTDP-glucose 4,6-dehydratase [Streptomyces sp. 9-7]
MRLLVTGAAGFIGSHYVRALLAGAYPGAGDVRVTVLDKLTYAGNPANLAPVRDHPGLTFVQGDICDGPLLADLLPGHDAVLNFAAESHVDRSIAGADAFVRTNVLGTHTLLEAVRRTGVPRFVQISTDEVYGSIEDGAWTEESPLLPNSPYAATKASADLLVRSYARTYGLDASITRCSNNYGPYQYPEKVIPLFVTSLLSGGTVPLYGDGRHVRDWLHVDDHCRGIHLVLERGRPGEVYHIGGGEELTNLHLTKLLLDACGAGPDRIRHVADRPGHDRRYALDDRKLRALGYAPQVPFRTGLLRTVAWYRDNPGWWQPLRVPHPR